MLLHLVHETRYAYSPTVESAHHVLHLKPASHTGQQLLRHSLCISPQPARLQELTDVYGNTRSYFSLQGPHDKLTVRATSIVSTLALNGARLDAAELAELPEERALELATALLLLNELAVTTELERLEDREIELEKALPLVETALLLLEKLATGPDELTAAELLEKAAGFRFSINGVKLKITATPFTMVRFTILLAPSAKLSNSVFKTRT